MITIDQLLESVDLDFEPRWVTKDKDGTVEIWSNKPYRRNKDWDCELVTDLVASYEYLKLDEFEDKDWTECIYEVPRKTTVKIGKLGKLFVSGTNMTMNQSIVDIVVNTLNRVIDAVNELNEANNE